MGDARESPVKPVKPKAKPKTASGNPKTIDMVVAAITAQADRKGATVPGIKSYIVQNYPTVDPAMLKSRLKRALEKGLEEGIIVRPKNAEDQGASLSGRFKLDKTKLAAQEKAKKPKPAKTDASKTASKTKKVAKKVEKSTSKSPKKAKTTPKKSATKKPSVAKKGTPKKTVKPAAKAKATPKKQPKKEAKPKKLGLKTPKGKVRTPGKPMAMVKTTKAKSKQ